MRDSFEGQFTIIRLIRRNTVEVRLMGALSRKHPVFPVSLVKPYHQTGEDYPPSRNKSHNPQDIVEVEDSPVSARQIMNSRNIRLNRKDYRQCLVRLKNQTADKYK
ncbi:hypothetical protein O181_006510 [Austropuccinia psidii MF-1]|uniref:Uncharacterized protein n=1 Tax=Austropuccinia psidii MF-1 TaxID=1389203 RepID=A0A9Q3GGX6_9BASI|nr:hypothetical protein [Austropuccinia psidii MF-1]